MPQRVEGSTEIQAPVGQVYGYWQTLENLPLFMANVEEVCPLGQGRTRWKMKGPFGAAVEFDARTTRDDPNEAIAWNSEGGDVETSGQVIFEGLGENRTRVEVTMNYADPPGGKLGEAASKIVADPALQIEQDLKNFKDIMEGKATPEEVQRRPSASALQGGLVAFLTSGAGLALLGGASLLFLLRRGRRGSARSGDMGIRLAYGRKGAGPRGVRRGVRLGFEPGGRRSP